LGNAGHRIVSCRSKALQAIRRSRRFDESRPKTCCACIESTHEVKPAAAQSVARPCRPRLDHAVAWIVGSAFLQGLTLATLAAADAPRGASPPTESHMAPLSPDAAPLAASSFTAVASPPFARRSAARIAEPALKAAGASWFVVAVLGQLIFAAYVVDFYGGAAVRGQFGNWTQVLSHGVVAGDTFGNLILILHLLFTVVIIAGGALQLVPAVRRLAPVVHRWNGRVYLLAALVLSLGGLVMVWTRGTVGDLSQHIAVSINALLIIGFAGMTWRHARARRTPLHRRWALRLFLAVSGVWFFRIGLMAWIVANQGPAGFDPKTFTGPFLTVLNFAQFVVPLAVLELYFWMKQQAGPQARLAMAAGLFGLTLLTAGGIAAATMIMWLPRM
jgi:Predicted membrane protein (DUF2306)